MTSPNGSSFAILPFLPFLLASLLTASGCGPLGNSDPSSASGSNVELDLVLKGGRVMDPGSGLDEVVNVGIRDGEIVLCTDRDLDDLLRPEGETIDVTGLVVAPGFIDLHAHGQSIRANEFQAMDGVTTALELEWGYPAPGAWIESKRGKSRVHFGAAASHGMVRGLAMQSSEETAAELLAQIREAGSTDEPLRSLQSVGSGDGSGDSSGPGFYAPLSSDQYPALHRQLKRALDEGGLGIGMAHAYTPCANEAEIFSVFQFAAEHQAPIFTHVRSMGIPPVQEVLANAAVTGAPLHLVHLNSVSLNSLPTTLEMVRSAQERGLDISAETYPYTAGSTALNSALFDEGWQEKMGGISYGDIQWQDTGERLTEATFKKYREIGGTVIIHMMKEEMIDLAISTDFVMVASDGMPYAPGAHPRTAGTFARVLGRYVREREALSLMEALKKMTLLPAKRLEEIAPMMKRKGRLSVGSDADITVFDPTTVRDTATFEDDLSYSEGIELVLVAGVPVVRGGELVPDVFPGQPVVSRFAP